MISVLNHLRLLNGNKTLVFFSFFLLIVSCGSLNVSKRNTVVLQPVEPAYSDETSKSGGVVITTDNKKQHKNAKASIVTFMGQQFEVPVSDVNEYRVAVILPFCFNKEGKINEQLKSVSMEYFEGVELALEELSKRGMNVHTEIFDSQNDTAVVSGILKQSYFKTVHLVIGPVYDSEFALVERFCSVYGIPLVNPLRFYSKRNRTSSPIYNPVSDDSNRHYLAALQLMKLFGTSKFVMLNDNTAAGLPARRAFLRAFNEKKKSLQIVDLNMLNQHIASSADLIVIAPTKSDITVHNLLNLTAGKKNVNVVGEMEWFDFPIIPFATWAKCNLFFYNNNTVSQDDSEVVIFNENYNAKFGGVSGKFSYIGYDQTIFFVQALAAFGTGFGAYIQGKSFPLMHTSFQFEHMNNDTYENRFVNILRLNENFDLEKIR